MCYWKNTKSFIGCKYLADKSNNREEKANFFKEKRKKTDAKS